MIFFLPIAFLLSLLLYSLFVPFFARFSPSRPNSRSSHHHDTASGGGVIFSLVFSFSSLLSIFYGLHGSVYLTLVPFICLPLSIVGFLDDCLDLSPLYVFVFRLLLPFFVISFSNLSFIGRCCPTITSSFLVCFACFGICRPYQPY